MLAIVVYGSYLLTLMPNLNTVVAFSATYSKNTTGFDPPGKTPAFARSARKQDAGKPLEPWGGEVWMVKVGSTMATN